MARGLQAALWPAGRPHRAAIATRLPRLRVAAMADVEDGEEPCALSSHSGSAGSKSGGDKMFSLKKWNAVAMWSWDVECDTCAICRVQVMGKRCTRGPGRATASAGPILGVGDGGRRLGETRVERSGGRGAGGCRRRLGLSRRPALGAALLGRETGSEQRN